MKTNIIHICEDEKFINSAIEQFEACFPNQNVFNIIKSNENDVFIHVKPCESVKKYNREEFKELASTISLDSIVILHSLSPRFYDFVLQLPHKIKIIWFCFGFEVYNDSNYFKNSILLDTITAREFPDKNETHKQRFIEKIRPFYRLIKKTLPLSERERKDKAIKRINYLGSSFKEEFEMVCKLINQEKEFFDFWYYPLELIVDSNAPVSLEKKTIIVGNSGFKTLNHLDVFDKIKSFNLSVEKVVVPLNYGKKQYIKTVEEIGRMVFKEKFEPLLDFIPLHDYNLILEEVGVAIINCKRQQAVGNIIGLLWMGAKVFLSKFNPFYSYLKRVGVMVYCYETELNEESCNQFLSLEEIKHNRSILFDLLNQEHLAKELTKQISTL